MLSGFEIWTQKEESSVTRGLYTFNSSEVDVQEPSDPLIVIVFVFDAKQSVSERV